MEVKKFPKGFLWGAATSAHQVEGGNAWNDWYLFEKAGNIKNNEVSGLACDHYHTYKEDFDLAKSLNHNSHRLSIEWSRIEKKKGVFDQEEIEHYKEVLKYLKDNGFATFVTLHHFTNPSWFANEGGWTNRKSVQYFLNYAAKVVPELNQYVDFWSTINEPMVVLSNSLLAKVWAPGKFAPIGFVKATFNMIRTHNESYKLIKQRLPKAKVGIVYNFGFTIKNNPISWIRNYGRNYFFMDKIKDNNDFIGFNYYFPMGNVRGAERTDLNWPIWPDGFKEALIEVSKRYKLPIYITENGIADALDTKRAKFILTHLSALFSAIKAGANIKGYLYWSLLDNFEWAEGFEPRFGLIEVDYKTQKRTIQKSALKYAEIIKNNAIY